ncbi:hypothetical protein BZG35_14245 [Brevundimonas sp. LM2]|uniref:Crp/Fnr family transcriptional regulator n=1 Tax=Brevundimonas sp. LM2 TaxID=1938605 RepID=UPI000983C86B|nr:Crp/Fnr family transcriptional regulator [Brevundimonas sp. LM2]AQR62678.1 hypothetical protein BZG35_14245 [Brevundimonas sp. LM2]
MAKLHRRNALLEQLSKTDRDAIAPHLSDFNFKLGQVFGEPDEDVRHICFVNHGIISAVSIMTTGETVEAYMVGFEGFTGVTAWLTPYRTSVRYVGQLAGNALRIEARRLRELSSDHPGLRNVLALYDASLQVELEQSAPCNALHRTEQRFAKWLLRAHDRAGGDTLFMRQEFLANMLGAQRTTVNEAAQSLASAGAITYSRGKVVITDRVILERAACECYAAAKGVADRRRASPAGET